MLRSDAHVLARALSGSAYGIYGYLNGMAEQILPDAADEYTLESIAAFDRADAQRITGITGDGDQGLIALAACQGCVRGVIEGLTGTDSNPSGRAGHE